MGVDTKQYLKVSVCSKHLAIAENGFFSMIVSLTTTSNGDVFSTITEDGFVESFPINTGTGFAESFTTVILLSFAKRGKLNIVQRMIGKALVFFMFIMM